ncbi:MAG: sigma-54-dependent Fis family transcriptional regulator [Runella slithyformis]|jgi:two-component system, NtrC family, nitrogen regulation response regulator NtrX|nr:MAG: sigma-54-dependent Fis family transcriptional regulator [Runella slithyformis]TAF00222.1 MAG: sigma-54-dependent Fis family transcriptional regulator [Runella slithyformis]TAF25505.1 MAG: sigma-54-dependent Fis family transcriptional regulator [Runella slithyformis]TAF43863.1 MAG: sigma-54-dependent Fis family transcriptional regulator [Runella slithyformis]TAF78748.1 MAG: sigma-54-dependent Fis family transcriptional regulator [Runella slithyformis]
MAKILIVDDEKAIRAALRDILEYEGYEVEEAKDGDEGLSLILKNYYDVALCDIRMPKIEGLEVLLKAGEAGRGTQFIMISAYGNVENAVEATKRGAYDFITKPPDLNRLLVSVRNAIEKAKLVAETADLKKRIYKINEIVGDSAPIKKVKETINRVAPTEARVMITGANGSGKEMVAKQIHEKSNRVNKPLVEVNCAAIPSELIESELFGHEKGSFTSAIKQRIGKFEQADGGTLFLDEIGDMSLSAQAKVLRALQESKITRVGGDKEIKINVRVIAATNKDLRQEIREGHFREDLYHRLSVMVIHVPSLAERREDVPLLAQKFLHDISEEYGDARKVILPEAMEALQVMPWTGNVRELRNVIERLVIMCGDEITADEVNMYVNFGQ